MNTTSITLPGFPLPVAVDEKGYLDLTGLLKTAGGAYTQRPAIWLKQDQPVKYLAATAADLNVTPNDLLTTKVGRGGGTYAHKMVALEYARYINAKLAVAVNKVFFERVEEEKNPDLILDRAVKTYERRGFTPERIAARLNAKATRVIFTAALARHGVSGDGFRQCTNAVYFPLFGGPAAVVRQKVGVGPKQNPRDHMSQIQLRTVELSEMLATEAIETAGAFGTEACVNETNRAARNVAAMVVRHRAGASL